VIDAVPSLRVDHVPVLLGEVLAALEPRDHALYVDGTFGGGGYSRALLKAADCKVAAIDRDPDAVARGADMAREFPGRLEVLHGRIGDMDAVLGARGTTSVDGGIVFDLGLSSIQLDDPARGFSFRHDGPLDMRLEPCGATAADIVASADEDGLTKIIRRYGEERYAGRVARAIVAARAEAPIERTGQLADVVRRVVPRSDDGIDPATRTFQALRIHLNDELGELRHGLAAAERLLGPGGRLAVVSFHSLEDRTVKQFLRQRSGAAPRPSRHHPPAEDERAATFDLLTRRAIRPSANEIAANPRARSARLRAAVRTASAPWPERRAA
jgi:16S rRNA (cytosine1402-N4)-methyltransferase